TLRGELLGGGGYTGVRRPEGWRPEGWRPEGWRPEGWRPEGWRPEGWRPKGRRPKGEKPHEHRWQCSSEIERRDLGDLRHGRAAGGPGRAPSGEPRPRAVEYPRNDR